MRPIPSCPQCVSPDRVDPIDAHGWDWLCAACVLVFVGDDAEFARMGPVRHRIASDKTRVKRPSGGAATGAVPYGGPA